MNLFQFFFVPLCILLAARAVLRSRRGHLSTRQAAAWGVVWTAAALLIAAPGTATLLAAALGIGRGSDLVFYGAILAGLWAFRHLHQRHRQFEIVLTELVRQDAIAGVARGDEQIDDGYEEACA